MRKYFREYERYQLELLLNQKTPVKEIAKILNRSLTTIYREIKLGTVELIDMTVSANFLRPARITDEYLSVVAVVQHAGKRTVVAEVSIERPNE